MVESLIHSYLIKDFCRVQMLVKKIYNVFFRLQSVFKYEDTKQNLLITFVNIK